MSDDDPMEALIEEVMARGRAGDLVGAWGLLSPHRAAADRDPQVGWAWIVLAKHSPDPGAHRAEIEALGRHWCGDPHIANLAARALYAQADGRPIDEPVADEDPAHAAAALAREALARLRATEDPRLELPDPGGTLWWTLGNALRVAGPAGHGEAAAALEQAQRLYPDELGLHFDRGLLFKFMRRWNDALGCFRRYLEDAPTDEGALENAAVCATILGQGELAASLWNRLGYHAVSLGQDGLPQVDGLAPVALQLPCADPGSRHEHVWATALSPCHARVITAPANSNAAAYSDLVAFDRLQLGWAERSGDRLPAFPFLARLRAGDALTAPFVARADEEALERLEHALPEGATLQCFDPPGPSVALVRGVLLVDAAVALSEVAARVEACQLALATPALYERAGNRDGAARAERAWAELMIARP